MNKATQILRFLITPHNPRNVAMWFFHKFMNSRLAIACYRKFVMPRVIRRVQKQKKIRVVFLPMNCAMWRYGDVYERMRNNPRFDPIIVTAPRIIQPKESYVREQREMVDFFTEKGYPITNGFDTKRDKWISLQSLNPDIIFYTQPYDDLLPTEFEYWNNLKSLICYTPYSFQFSKVNWNWDNAIQNYAWRHYVSLPFHVELCKEYSRVKAQNAVAAGYFFEEEYQKALANTSLAEAIWKHDKRKRVIWAPHHSIRPGASFKSSSFLEIYDAMLALRNRFADRIIIAFKPHPMLLDNLYQLWGREKADAYYNDWAKSPNSFLADGAFIPLFAGSDAMIHCSGSFIVDYMYTNKPVQFVYCKDHHTPEFGEIANTSLDAHYPARSAEDIENFIKDVVLSEKDSLRARRESIYQKHLKSPNGKTFSENVIVDIIQGIER